MHTIINPPLSTDRRRESTGVLAGAPLAVAQVIGRFGGGGAERLAYNLAVGLGARGTRSYAIALRRAELGDEPVPAGVELAELGASPGKPWTAVRALFRFRAFVRARRIDVIHIHGRDTLLFCAVATLGMRPRPRLLFTWHASEGVLTGRGVMLVLMRWALRRCERVLASSREVAAQLNDRARLRTPAEVFVNGVAEPAAPWVRGGSRGGVGGVGGGRARLEGAPLIVWAARLVPSKDPQMLVRAAARLRDEGLAFRVVLAGSSPASHGWVAEETGRLIREHGLGGIVSMPGWIEDTSELFLGASIAVQTSRTEGLSLSLLEQMMAGLAIVATDVGDTSTAIHDARTGLLIPVGDEAALVAALRCLIRRPEWRGRLGRQARALAMSEFTLPRMAERAAEEYGRLATAGRR